jgi:hypothetical protein
MTASALKLHRPRRRAVSSEDSHGLEAAVAVLFRSSPRRRGRLVAAGLSHRRLMQPSAELQVPGVIEPTTALLEDPTDCDADRLRRAQASLTRTVLNLS